MFILLIMVCSFAERATAQVAIFNQVPLNETITVTLLGSDKAYLHCYNLYGFEWKTDTDSLTGEFIVLKNEDSFQHQEIVKLKLCRIKEFAIMAAGQCRKIPVETGLQLEYPGVKEKIFLNFDPEGPDPLFIPCK